MAITEAGLEDFGPADYHEPLRVLLDSVDEDAAHRLSEKGVTAILHFLSEPLISRLYTQDGWNRHPQYKQVRIEKPLVILGLPRTGSTGLHKLLSIDPQFQSIPMWLFQRPAVRPPRSEWHSSPEYQACIRMHQQSFAGDKTLNEFHDMVLDEADECWWGLRQSFIQATLYSGIGLPSYANWWYQQSEKESYLRYADLLRLIGLNDNRRWLLKNPYHLVQPEALFNTFPGVCVIQTHRNPATVLPSFANLIGTAHTFYFGEKTRPRQTAMMEVFLWMMGVYRTEQVRKQYPDRFYDVVQRDFLHHPLEVVKGIYTKFGLALTDQVIQAMESYVANQDQERRFGHEYTAEEFGLNDDSLRELFQPYIEKYQL